MKRPPKGIGLYIRELRSGELKYESRLWNPYLDRIGKTKIWSEKDLNKVIVLHLQLKLEYKSSDYEVLKSISKAPYKPMMILECASLYEKFLKDDPEVVPLHKSKNRDEKYIKNTIKYIRTFLEVLIDEGVKVSRLHVSSLNDDLVALFFEYLESRYDNEEIGEVTWNRHMTALRNWVDTLIDQFHYSIQNPFKNITKKREETDPDFLEPHEIEILLKMISKQNGIGYKGRNHQTVNYYRDWLKHYFYISILVGARTKEIANLKWKHVKEDYIVIESTKTSGSNTGNVKIKQYAYIYPELAEILAPLQAKSKSDEEYILVPDQPNRKQLQRFAAASFRHYYKQSGIKKRITIYKLRHTWVNLAFNLIGENALDMRHKKEVAIRNYLSKKKAISLQKGKNLLSINTEFLK